MHNKAPETGPGPCPLRRCGDKEYFCSVELVLQVIGGKWKPIILWHLGNTGTLRFGQLKRTMPNITQKMLTQQLRELEADGMVRRRIFAQVPPKVEYSLTQMGSTVMPLLRQMCAWGDAYEAWFATHQQEEPAEADA